jgi:hypothetical protein
VIPNSKPKPIPTILRSGILSSCILLAIACGSPPAEPPAANNGASPVIQKDTEPVTASANADIEVLVIDGATGKPAKSVLVKLNFSPSNSLEATTDQSGLAAFKDQPTSTAAKVAASETSGKKRSATQEVPTGFIEGKNQIRIDLQ